VDDLEEDYKIEKKKNKTINDDIIIITINNYYFKFSLNEFLHSTLNI
jgi:hypothetical protein